LIHSRGAKPASGLAPASRRGVMRRDGLPKRRNLGKPRRDPSTVAPGGLKGSNRLACTAECQQLFSKVKRAIDGIATVSRVG
jgi:hypothetical protein